MRRPDVGLFWNILRERLEAESEVEFPSRAFCQVESLPDCILQIGLRDGNLQAHRFNCRPICRPILGDVLGFVGSVFCVHGIYFFCCFVSSSTGLRRCCKTGWSFVYGVNTP